MTKEEKAKAYEKAIEIAKDKYAKFKGMLPGNVLEDVFPELKENEDERIKKNCIHFLELQKQHHAATFEIEECIDWLKKQKSVDLDDINIIKMVDNYSFTDEYDEKGNCKGKPVNCEIEAYKKGIKDILKIVKQNKSIHLQKHWKPSEEQIEALNEVIRNPYLSNAEYIGLVALKEQLKVL